MVSFVYVKKIKKDYYMMRTVLLKDNQTLRSRAELLQETAIQKTEIANTMEKEKKVYEEQANSLKEELEKLRQDLGGQVDLLTKKKAALRKRIYMLEKAPLASRIKAAMQGETDRRIINIMNDTLSKVELVKSGKAVSLEPIEVSAADQKGTVLSIDRKNDLAIVSIGTKDGLMEGDRCKIYGRDGTEIASAEVISARYAISACFVDDMNYGYNIKSIKEGCSVIIAEKK